MTETGAKPVRLTRKERQAETKRKLLDAAEAVFLRRGFDRSSVEEICAEAGFTRGAFYSNFESKEEMFFQLLADRVYEEYARLLDQTPRDMTPREQLRWSVDELIERYESSNRSGNPLVRLWFECLALAMRDERFRELAAGFWKGTRAIVAERFRKEYERRGVELPQDPGHLASAMIALDIGLSIQRLVDPEAVPLDVYPPLYEILFGGLVEPEPA